MKIIPHTKEMIKEAQEWGKSLGAIKNSIVRGRGNMAGKLGELAFSAYIGSPLEDRSDYDMIHGGERLEIKTKRRTVPPLQDYDVSVAPTSTHQKADRYVFISIEFDRKDKKNNFYGVKSVWLCGDKDVAEYRKNAFLHTMGSMKPSGVKVNVDMLNMRVRDLDQSF